MSAATERAHHNLFHEPIVKYAAGSGPHVLDLRFATGFTPWFAAGTGHEAQPCDETGTVLPGSSSAALAAGTEITPVSPFYRITVDGANDLEITRVGSG